MILSCHVPKTAGTSFAKILAAHYGERLHLDYGDRVGWSGPEADKWRRSRAIPAKLLRGAIDIVHGHFYLSKYLELFPGAAVVAFVRDPVDRVVSNYRFLAAHSEIDHPLVTHFHRESPTLLEWAALPWARDLQSKVLAGRAIEDLSLVGITERYSDSLRRFDALFGTDLAVRDSGERHNRSDGSQELNPEVRVAIAALNRADSRLYQSALAIFETRVRV